MSESEGRVEAIWIKRFKGGPMDPVESARAIAGKGLEGNAFKSGKRQVTLLSAEKWADAQKALGVDVDPILRRANLLVAGMDFVGRRGQTLRIGECRVRIYGETKPCHQMEAAHAGLQAALQEDQRGGVFGEVLDDETIAVGDQVVWVDEA